MYLSPLPVNMQEFVLCWESGQRMIGQALLKRLPVALLELYSGLQHSCNGCQGSTMRI